MLLKMTATNEWPLRLKAFGSPFGAKDSGFLFSLMKSFEERILAERYCKDCEEKAVS